MSRWPLKDEDEEDEDFKDIHVNIIFITKGSDKVLKITTTTRRGKVSINVQEIFFRQMNGCELQD